jgi:hypothetical protein
MSRLVRITFTVKPSRMAVFFLFQPSSGVKRPTQETAA